jgi:DNA-binding LacI/PurR family transcriptional regulator
VDPDLMVPGDWRLPSGYQGAEALLQVDDPPTAVFACSDRMALGAIYACQEAGVRVPEEVAVVGYDDRDFAHLVRPALTTVRTPGYEMGARAAELLLDKIQGGFDGGCEVPVPGELIVRDSCGAMAAVAANSAPPEWADRSVSL